MSASSRAKVLPLLRSSLSARNASGAAARRGGCWYSSVATGRVPLSRTATCHPSSSRSAGAAPGKGCRAEGVRWNSTGGSDRVESVSSSSSSSSSSSAGSEAGESAASSQTSLGSESGAEEARPTPRSFAFAFEPIPGAAETLKFLQRSNIPFILLTNGGGKSEAERVADLTEKLGVDLDVSNFVQSHTPYQKLLDPDAELGFPKLEEYLQNSIGRPRFSGKETVLVLGSDASKARRIANGYGFESVVTPGDILAACPEIFPFNPLREFYEKQEVLPLPKPVYSPSADPAVRLEDCLKIDGILTFNDPRDWAVDIQLVTDLLLSHRGYLGTYSDKNGGGGGSVTKGDQWQNDGQPALIFSNVDLQWSTGYHQSRLGQGAFQGAVERVFTKLANKAHMKSFLFGKPWTPTYAHAWATLEQHRRRLGNGRLGAVYMVGDNLESDIRGTYLWNSHVQHSGLQRPLLGPYWKSCLVRTGVWKEEIRPIGQVAKGYKPRCVVDDVRAAVEMALKEQHWPGMTE
ncbi:hypothetical protein Daus18300_010839 [Diaporthe australafricana]|uniref:Uncharacterized protein n=1 Tax=Diaporthe australafricana TaxID=127596 RepID=A0ABR3W8W0_9PEZI